jgi:hypothetical protein
LVTLADFKATVADFIERQDGQALPRPGQLVLLGHAEDSGWKRTRIKRPYTWVAGWMVRGFIVKWTIDRLAIVIPGDAPRQFRVGFTERDSASDSPGIADRRLATLIAAAHEQWSQKPRRLWRLWGRPWPELALIGGLALQFGLLIERFVLRGPSTDVAYDGYYALIAVTTLALLLRVRLSQALALLLAAVQLVRTFVLFAPLIQARGLGAEAFWLAAWLVDPAFIVVMLWLVYADRAQQSVLKAG